MIKIKIKDGVLASITDDANNEFENTNTENNGPTYDQYAAHIFITIVMLVLTIINVYIGTGTSDRVIDAEQQLNSIERQIKDIADRQKYTGETIGQTAVDVQSVWAKVYDTVYPYPKSNWNYVLPKQPYANPSAYLIK